MGISRRRFLESSAAASALLALPVGAATLPAHLTAQCGVPLESDFGRLSDRARRVIQLAIREASEFQHDRICSEHLLLGLAAEAEEQGATWLESLGTSLEDYRYVTQCIVGEGAGDETVASAGSNCDESKLGVSTESAGDMPLPSIAFSQNFIECLDEAIDEADLMGYQRVQPEHLLIGLIGVQGATANWLLDEMWIEPTALHQEALASLNTWGEAEA